MSEAEILPDNRGRIVLLLCDPALFLNLLSLALWSPECRRIPCVVSSTAARSCLSIL